MIEIKWTPFALGSLDEIYDYIVFREKSSRPAIKLINKLFSRVDQLSEFPESGQIEPILNEIGQKSRYLVEASYKIIYEFDKKGKIVIITDVFHTSQYPGKIDRSK